MEKTILIEKSERENAISISILVANFFLSKYLFFVAKLSYTIPNFFITVIAFSIEYCPSESGIFLLKS